MAATRRPPAPEVYHDPDASGSGSAPVVDHRDVEATLFRALEPLADASHKQNVQLLPPPTATATAATTATTMTSSRPGSSPTKTDSSPLRPLSARRLADIKIPPPLQPNFHPGSPRKRAGGEPGGPRSAGAPAPALGPPHPGPAWFGKENVYGPAAFAPMPSMPPMPYGAQPPYPAAPAKGAMKRTATDTVAPPPKDRAPAKKPKTERDEPFELPDPADMPLVVDEPDGSKPNYSYAQLIGMAILRAPNRRLTLAHIYKWISDNFAYYRTTDSGWQNSIRHNLSLNKNFVKQERPKDDPGKGNYWGIKPGEERPFLVDKKNPIRRLAPPDDSAPYMYAGPADVAAAAGFRPATAPAIGQFTLAPNPAKKVDTKTVDFPKFVDEAELSSDGTIPASDPALHDDDDDDKDDEEEDDPAATAMPPPPPAHFRSSPPPPADIGSSPPPMLSIPPHRRGTPPPVSRLPPSSRSGGRRRKFGSLNDSGYWSSIESSAARAAAHPPTSDADVGRHRLKKGRAEAEIARMRSSSFDSPSKDGAYGRRSAASFSSSPLKDDHPLTPVVVFKRPPKPPPSISPNTNLRNHRDRMKALLGSPAKPFSPLPPEASNWSPAFNLADDSTVGLSPYKSPSMPSRTTPWRPVADAPGDSSNLYNATFDIFIDAPAEDATARGSPAKRSSRRPSLARAATSTGILADITGSVKNNHITLAPPSDSPFSLSPFISRHDSLRSPSKSCSPLKFSHKPPATTTTATTTTSSSTAAHGASPDFRDFSWAELGTGTENVQPGQPQEAATHDVAELFGVQLHSDGSEEAIDLFQDFGKIGQAPPHLLPTVAASTGSPVKRSTAAPPSRKPSSRPGLARSSTNAW